MGMLCGHVLKVMDFLGMTEIPQKHIVKRWTRDARDILPEHLQHYQRDKIGATTLTFRHNRMYVQALELVRLGDASVEAYETLMALFNQALVVMTPFDMARDGLGLEDRVHSKGQPNGGTVQGPCNADQEDRNSVQSNPLAGLAPPAKKKKSGRPTNGRDKAPYEGMTKRSRFCSICKVKGHKRTTCPQRGDAPKMPRKEAKCSNCGVVGHRKNTCDRSAGQGGDVEMV